MKYFTFFILIFSNYVFSQTHSESYDRLLRELPELLKKNNFDPAAYQKKKLEELHHYKVLSLAGDPKGMYQYSNAIAEIARTNDDKDLIKVSFYWLNRSANEGYIEALKDLGHIYHYGKSIYGEEMDLFRAASFFKKASDLGSREAEIYYLDITECELAEVKAEDC